MPPEKYKIYLSSKEELPKQYISSIINHRNYRERKKQRKENIAASNKYVIINKLGNIKDKNGNNDLPLIMNSEHGESCKSQNLRNEALLPCQDRNIEEGNCYIRQELSPLGIKRSLNVLSESDDVDTPSKVKVLQFELQNMRKKLKKLETENDMLKSKLEENRNSNLTEENENELAQLKKRNECLQKLNFELLNKNLELQNKILDEWQNHTCTRKDINKEKQMAKANVMSETMKIGPVSIPISTFEVISSTRKNSIFIKELVKHMWKEEELLIRSVTGRKCRTKTYLEYKKCLTPEKIYAIRDIFEKRLDKRNITGTSKERELKLMNKYIAEKICDLNKRRLKKRRYFNQDNGQQNDVSRSEETSN